MTTLCGSRGKKIQFSTDNTIHQDSKNMYVVELPIVKCTNQKDAEFIQKEVRILINNLSRNLLENN